jgi:hypothetical protein
MSLDTHNSKVTLNLQGSKPKTCFKTTFKDKNRICFKDSCYKNLNSPHKHSRKYIFIRCTDTRENKQDRNVEVKENDLLAGCWLR